MISRCLCLYLEYCILTFNSYPSYMNIVVYILVVVNYNKIPTNENVCVFAVKTVKERQFF